MPILKIFFTALLIGLPCFPSYAFNKTCEQKYCVAVIDAGSTGTRLHIFSYDLDENNTPIAITERWAKKIRPGLTSIEPNQNEINRYLGNLFSGTAARRLPVYFFSTAGMRLMAKSRQDRIYLYVQEWFKRHSNWQLDSARTISGSEEGLFAWLAINYQLGTLTNPKESVGVLDMGGASVQVAFPVKEASQINNPENIQEVDLYGKHFTLFVHSFLGLGLNEVSHQFLESKSCFSTNYELPTGASAEGDSQSCESEVSSLINTVHQVNKVVQPAKTDNPVDHWYVMGALVDLVTSKPFHFDNNEFSNQELLEKANTDLCHQDWPALSAQYNDDDYLFGYCLLPSYYYALIVDGYGISAQQKFNYLPADQNNDWTMGVVLYQKSLHGGAAS